MAALNFVDELTDSFDPSSLVTHTGPVIVYDKVAPKNELYLNDWANEVRAIIGPVGTAKTYTQFIDAFYKAKYIKPNEEGIKRSHIAFVREKYEAVKGSVIKQMEHKAYKGIIERVPSSNYPFIYEMKYFDEESGYPVHCTFSFWGFRDKNALDQLLSQEMTAVYMVEAQENFGPELISSLFNRIRFSGSLLKTKDKSRSSIIYEVPIDLETAQAYEHTGDVVERNGSYYMSVHRALLSMDCNYTHVSQWIKHYLVDENEEYDEYRSLRKVYEQPPIYFWKPGAKPKEETDLPKTFMGDPGCFIRNWDAEPYIAYQDWPYYENQIHQNISQPAKIMINVLAKFATSAGIDSCFHQFDHRYVFHHEYKLDRDRPIFIGMDQGILNGWAFGQQEANGNVVVFHEISNHKGNERSDSIGHANVLENMVIPYLNELGWDDENVVFILDPILTIAREGSRGVDLTEPFHGFIHYPAPYRAAEDCINVANRYFEKGKIKVANRCKYLVKALEGEYTNKSVNGEMKPNKDCLLSGVGDGFAHMIAHIFEPAKKVNKKDFSRLRKQMEQKREKIYVR